MAVATFGMTWQMSGTQTFEIPDGIDLQDTDAVSDYLRDHWNEIPIPENGEYIGDSDALDGIVSIQANVPSPLNLHFTVERVERIGFERQVSAEEYEEFRMTGAFPFDVYEEAGFSENDGADYDYAVTDDEGKILIDWD